MSGYTLETSKNFRRRFRGTTVPSGRAINIRVSVNDDYR